MLLLRKESVRVVEGKLCRSNGLVLEVPAILIYDNEIVRYGDLNNMSTNLLQIHHVYEVEGKDISKIRMLGFDMDFAKDYSIHDVCYIIRRGIEIGGSGFTAEVCKRWNSRSFWEWVKVERKLFPIQTSLE